MTRRRLVVALTAALGLAALFTLLLHTRPARSFVTQRLVSTLQTAGIDLAIDSLDYNLLTLRASARGVTLTAAGHPTPFFSADRVRVQLDSSILFGRLRITELDLAGARLTLLRGPGASFNVPSGATRSGTRSETRSDTTGETVLPVDRLTVLDLDIEVEDESLGWSAAIENVSAALFPKDDSSEGTIEARGPVSVTWGEQRVDIDRLAASVAFNGRDLDIASLVLDATDGRVEANGRIAGILSEPLVDMAVEGSLDLARLSSLLLLDPAIEGRAGFSGTTRGPIASPSIEGRVSLDAASWRTIHDLRSQALLTFTAGRLDLESIAMEVAEGRAEGSASFILGEDGTETRADLRITLMALGPFVDLVSATPVPVGGRVSGTLSVRRPETGWHDVELAFEATTSSRGSSRPLGLDGRLSLATARGQWRAGGRQRIGGSIDVDLAAQGELGTSALADTTLRGRLSLSVANLGRALDGLSAASLVRRPDGEPIDGRLDADLTLGGTFGRPVATGLVALEDGRYADLGPATVTARLLADTDRLEFEDVALSSPQGQGSGLISVALARDTLDGTFELSLSNVDALLPDTMPVLLDEPVRAQLAVTGSTGSPSLAADVRGGRIIAMGQPFDDVTGRVRFVAGALIVRDLRLSRQGASVEASGSYTLGSGRFAATVRARDVSLQPIAIGDDTPILVGGTVALDFEGSGETTQPEGKGHVTIANLVYGERPLGPLEADVTLGEGRARIDAVARDLPARLQALVTLESPYAFTAEAEIDDADLAALARRVARNAAQTVSGRTSVSATASGNLEDPAAATSDVIVRRLRAEVRGIPISTDAPVHMRYQAGAMATPGIDVRVGEGRMTIAGAFGEPGRRLSIDAGGDLSDLAPTISALVPGAPALEGSGLVTAHVEVDGSVDRFSVTGRLDVADARIGPSDQPLVDVATLRARLADGVVTLDELRAGWQGASATARGRLPLRLFAPRLPAALVASLPDEVEPANFEARVEDLTQAALAPYVAADALSKLDLLLGAEIRIETADASIEQLRGTLRVEPAQVTVEGVTLRQEAPAVIGIEHGRLEIRDWAWRGQRTSLVMSGTVGLTGEYRVDLGAGGEIDLRLLSAFVPVAVSGEARFVAGLSGDGRDPSIAGEIALSNGELRLAEPRLVIGNLAGLVQLSQHRIVALEVTGTANGGPLRLTADVAHEWLVPSGGRVTVEASGVALQPFQGLRTEIDSNVSLELVDGDSRLTGTVTVARGAYREPLTILGQILQRASQASPAPAEVADRTFLERMSLGVTLATRDDLLVDNNIANLAVGLDLTIVGTGARPSLVGRAAVREGGTLFLAGNVFQIAAGTIDFANSTVIEPDMSISASTRVGGEDISLNVSGTPATLRVDLTSTGNLSDTDIVSLLVTGRTEGALGVEVARDQVLGFLTGEFLAVAGRAVGLDVVRFERGDAGQSYRFDPSLVATETDPASRLTLGKNLRRDLQLVFSQNLRRSGSSTWIVSYKPLGNIEVRGVVRDNRDRSYEFRHDLSFGGARRAGRASPPRASARVGTEQFAGSPGLPADELGRLTKLKPGSRFDFYTWQADRERLERRYHDAGYREVQIRPGRTVRRPLAGPRSSASGPTVRRPLVGPRSSASGSDDIVDLEYTITSGPLTTIAATGYDLPASLMHRVETLWSESVVDTFFIEEAERAVRLHLADAGHLRAHVRGELAMDTGANRKSLNVIIDVGPRTQRRVVDVAGHSALSTARIERFAEFPHDWLEPDVIERRIEEAYRQAGWIDADVAVAPPVFEGGTARLDVHVSEGVQYTIGPVRIDGQVTRPAADIASAPGLEPGGVYTPAKAASARTRIGADYRRLGFNNVRIGLAADLDRQTATAVIRLTVDEGTQEVVADVTVDGAERTAPSLIARALSIQSGGAVDLSALYRSRQRLFATGIFRRVDLDLAPIGEPAEEAGGRRVQPVEVKAVVEEWPAYRLRYGLGVNDEKSIDNPESRTQTAGLVAELTRRNLFGYAISVGAAGRLERRQRIGRVFGSAPMLFGAPIASQVYMSWLRNKLGEGSERPAIRDVTSVSFEQRIRPWKDAVVSYAYAFERNHTFRENPNPNDPFGDFKIDIARLTSSLAIEKRDDPLNATRGWFHSSAFEYSSERLGSQLRFAKYFGTLNGYLPLRGDIVLASGSRVGLADAFNQVLIPTERFFAGGGNSVRGYAEDAIGPSDFFGPLGGNALLVFNEEVRFPIWRMVRGLGFLDAGGVFGSLSEMSLGDLDASVGLGLRIDTPFGLFRVDYGRPLSRTPADPAGRWFFSLGQLF